MAVIAGSIIFRLGQSLYARRKGSTRRCECKDIEQFCSFASWVQLFYLVIFVVRTTLLREETRESHFILGVALMHTVDRLELVGAAW
jgi:hypothetical protein